MTSPGSFPTLESLHFPSAQTSISQTLSSLRRSALSVSNRLQSIETDAVFVKEVAEHYGLPLVANERCGSWYIDPEVKLLPLASEYGGCVIVDSTRRGKLMPDALSKTIPIWCAVLNRALFPTQTAYHAVTLPPNYLGESEESQIANRIDGFVHSLQSLKLDLERLRQQLGKPLRVAWANRSYFHPTDLHKSDEYHLLVLCSASKRVHGAEMSEGGYIQGAGDDSEAWAHGLTPPVFWANRLRLKRTSEEDLPGVIDELVGEYTRENTGHKATGISPTRNLYISQTDASVDVGAQYDLVIDCNGDPAAGADNPKRLNLGCASAKLGSRDLRKSLDKVRDFVGAQLGSDPSRALLVTCDTGKDLSAGALLAIICLFYTEDGTFDAEQSKRSISKQFIRQRLAWIVSSKHDVNPSRSTLQSVNAFLMQPPDY
ncbi:tRNA A64-2'-O-ribosylphosphate transferase [Penicillium ochrochloron]